VAAWRERDNADEDWELFSRLVDSGGAPVDEPLALTDNALDDSAPALGRTAEGNALVAWRLDEPEGAEGRLQLLGADGVSMGALRALGTLGQVSARPAVVSLADGAGVGWVDASTSRARLQPVNASGAPIGMPQGLSVESEATGTVDLARGAGGDGAAVFDVRVSGSRPEVRLRRFDGMGEPKGSPTVITEPPATGQSASVTPFRDGYAVAYRGSKDGVMPETLRLALVSGEGELLSTVDLAEPGGPARRLAIRASPGGDRLFVTWMDDHALMLTRLRCEG
jgi:hypothetical protein